jgi:CPA2 family monovalent cation:H+ antiporter-2
MSHLPKLIEDLALILALAGIITLLFKKLKQPVVLGYILAGLLVSPNVSWLPNVSDRQSVQVWADIGVIVLLFSLGLEFSFKKLVKVSGTAGIAGIFEITCMIALGYFTGKLMGWPTMDCIFLGGIIAISSTTIIIRAFDELGVKAQKFAGLVLGILVIEDLVAVLLMVLLSTIAVSQTFEGGQMLQSVFKLLFFLSLWFISGIFILPTFFKWVRRLINEETLLVMSLGLCLLMVVLATHTGFSAPLGAFIMGSILAETTQAEKIEHLVKPVKDLFGAIFFVSVGLLIEVPMLIKYALPVAVLVLIVIAGKTISVTIGSLLSGQPLKQSLQAGMSLSQIGEFSFIIANLGLSLNVTGRHLYPIAVGVSVITAFTTPYMIKLADPLYHWLDKKLPLKWRTALNQYSTGAQTIRVESDWKIVLRSYLTVMLVNSVIVVALVLLSARFLLPFVSSNLGSPALAAFLTCFITFVAMAPFLWALAIRRIHSFASANLWLDQKYNHGPLVLLEVMRNILLIILVGFLVDRLFGALVALMVVLPVIVVVLLVFSRRLNAFYSRIEKRFLSNLNDRETTAAQGSHDLSPWDAHLAYFTILPESPAIGQTLLQLSWREKYGVNVALIERGKRTIYAPSRDVMIHPYDKMAVIGTDVQLENFRSIVEIETGDGEYIPHKDDIILNKLIIDNRTDLRGKSIRDSGIREIAHGLVVGIERDGTRILNPDSSTVFEWDDIIWIVGERKMIQKLVKE